MMLAKQRRFDQSPNWRCCHVGNALLWLIVDSTFRAGWETRRRCSAVGGDVGSCEDAVALRQLRLVDKRGPQSMEGNRSSLGAASLRETLWGQLCTFVGGRLLYMIAQIAGDRFGPHRGGG